MNIFRSILINFNTSLIVFLTRVHIQLLNCFFFSKKKIEQKVKGPLFFQRPVDLDFADGENGGRMTRTDTGSFRSVDDSSSVVTTQPSSSSMSDLVTPDVGESDQRWKGKWILKNSDHMIFLIISSSSPSFALRLLLEVQDAEFPMSFFHFCSMVARWFNWLIAFAKLTEWYQFKHWVSESMYTSSIVSIIKLNSHETYSHQQDLFVFF